jgi:hypothetical protein
VDVREVKLGKLLENEPVEIVLFDGRQAGVKIALCGRLHQVDTWFGFMPLLVIL